MCKCVPECVQLVIQDESVRLQPFQHPTSTVGNFFWHELENANFLSIHFYNNHNHTTHRYIRVGR